MANYEDLRAFFDGQGRLQEIASSATRFSIVTGITINVDPLWALFHDVGTGLVHRGAHVWLDYYEGYLLPWILNFPEFEAFLPIRENNTYWQHQGYRRRDLNYSDARWERVQKLMKDRFGFDRFQVIMTIVHRPIRTPILETSEASDDQDQLRSLIEIINESRVLIRIEERPEAHFSIAAGDEISTSGKKTGTLGGVLHDVRNQKSYGVTCAHVAATNDDVYDSNGNFLGNCIYDTDLVPLHVTKSCDPVMLSLPKRYPGNGPDLNMLDCSLVELTTKISTTQLYGIASALSPGQDVKLKGAQNHVDCKLGSLAISYLLTGNKQSHCFRDAIELKPKPRLPLGGVAGQLTASVPTKGDSGAWVLTDDWLFGISRDEAVYGGTVIRQNCGSLQYQGRVVETRLSFGEYHNSVA